MFSPRWSIAPADFEEQQRLAKLLGVHPITAQLLLNRNITTFEDATRFLEPRLADLPDPHLLPDMERGVACIVNALKQGERIAVYGDYDVDGISSVALLARFLRMLGVMPILHIPHRHRDGYGMTIKGVESLHAQGAKLLITVDNGIRNRDEVKHARTLGMKVVITDHHTFGILPEAEAVINPQREGTPKSLRHLCGCGVVFMLLIALRRQLRHEGFFPEGEPNLKTLLDIVAIATIADAVPLLGANRILVSIGFQQLRTTEHVGLQTLFSFAGLRSDVIRPRTIAFTIAPRLNAAGRLADPEIALHLLITEERAEAEHLASRLEELNSKRQQLQEHVLQEAFALCEAEPPQGAVVVFHPEWEMGVAGIVASKLAERYGQPALVFAGTGEELRGSVRSVEGLNIVAALEECAEYLVKFGGHPQAAGVVIRQEQLPLFRKRLSHLCAERLCTLPPPTLRVDAELNPQEITPELLEEIERFEPCGIGNPEPLFAAQEMEVTSSRVVGKNHLKFSMVRQKTSFDAIGFYLGELHPPPPLCHIAFKPQISTWNGVRTLQLNVKELLPNHYQSELT